MQLGTKVGVLRDVELIGERRERSHGEALHGSPRTERADQRRIFTMKGREEMKKLGMSQPV